jgi:hypothetical protein
MAGASLGGTGSITIDGNANKLDVQAASVFPAAPAAELSIGTSGSAVAQTLTINLQNGADITLAGILKIDLLLNQGGNTLAEADRLIITKSGIGTSTIDLSGSILKVSAVNGLVPANFNIGDSWKLIDWATIAPTSTFSNLTGTYSQNFADLPDLGALSGKFWDLNNLYTQGTITVAVPEPGRLVLLLLGLMSLAWRRRRRRGLC